MVYFYFGADDQGWSSFTSALTDRHPLRGERDFRAAERPVYRNNAVNPRPVHVGSCLLLNVDSVPLVVTAAHILDQRTNDTLYIGAPFWSHPASIVGGATMATPTRDAGRASDHFDTAVWIPPLQVVDMLGAASFIDHSRISHHSKPSAGRLYTALGYPRSRNRNAIDHVTRSISTHISM